MKNIDIIKDLSDFQKFENNEGIIEIVTRAANKRFKSMQKVMIDSLTQKQNTTVLKNMFETLDQSKSFETQTLSQLVNIQQLSQLNLVLDGLNLCATTAGFTIMYMKLNKMSKQINEVLSTIKNVNDTHNHYEFKKILSLHSDMLDHRKIQKYYTEEQMRELIDGEYNVLSMLLEVFEKRISEDTETLIYSILSLASMLTVSIKYFDEIYYFNNKEVIKNGEIWHSSHQSWINIFDEIISLRNIEILQDFAVLNKELSLPECDLFCWQFIESIKDAKQDIEDNQYLLLHFDNDEIFNKFISYNDSQICLSIENAMRKTGIIENQEIKDAYSVALKQTFASL